MDRLTSARPQLRGSYPVSSRPFAASAWWGRLPVVGPDDVQALDQGLGEIRQPFAIGPVPEADNLPGESAAEAFPAGGYVPACPLENLGDPTFCADHRVRYAYLAGAMANGIGSAEVVEAMGRGGMLAFFGAAGLALPAVEAAIDRLQRHAGRASPYGFNLIHSPNEPDLEAAVVDLYLRRGVRLVEASAFLDLTLPVVRYRVHGIHRDSRDGSYAQPGHRQGVARRGGGQVPGAAAGRACCASWSRPAPSTANRPSWPARCRWPRT